MLRGTSGLRDRCAYSTQSCCIHSCSLDLTNRNPCSDNAAHALSNSAGKYAVASLSTTVPAVVGILGC